MHIPEGPEATSNNTDIAVRWQSRHTATGIHVPYGITQR